MNARAIAIVAITTLAAAATARAQSTRYPPPPVDPDADADTRSSFWEAALEPGLGRYRQLVDQARRLIEQRDPEPMSRAVDLLTEATRLEPDRALGWWYLGVARESREDWAGCAGAYEAAARLDPAIEPRPALRARPQIDHALGVCLARAGRLDDARRHLERLARSGDADSEVWLRTGEVYMALGRLADAEDAIGRAALDAAISPDVHWALAIAYDRARKDADAEVELATALRLDPSLTRVAVPNIPYLSAAEGAYYQGLAAATAGIPERALIELRRFVALAPGSPWKARAQQHLADLAQTDWPARVELQGTSSVDRDKAIAAVRAGWPTLTACVKGHDGLLVQVRVVLLGPSKGSSIPGAPPPGTRATALAAYGEHDQELAAALSCVEEAASHLALPKPVQPNGFARIAFPVVSPQRP